MYQLTVTVSYFSRNAVSSSTTGLLMLINVTVLSDLEQLTKTQFI